MWRLGFDSGFERCQADKSNLIFCSTIIKSVQYYSSKQSCVMDSVHASPRLILVLREVSLPSFARLTWLWGRSSISEHLSTSAFLSGSSHLELREQTALLYVSLHLRAFDTVKIFESLSVVKQQFHRHAAVVRAR